MEGQSLLYFKWIFLHIVFIELHLPHLNYTLLPSIVLKKSGYFGKDLA